MSRPKAADRPRDEKRADRARVDRARRGRAGAARPHAPASGTWRHERAVVAALLVLHLALVVWGIARNSVMFDENFHLPAGIAIVARRDFSVSVAQPPLVKTACALAALAAGARLPPAHALPPNAEYAAAEDFQHANRDRFVRVFTAARLVVAALSALLGLLVWHWARRLHGPRGAGFALAVYALSPEVVAHAGVVGMDLATALGFTASLYAFWRFARSGAWGWWACTALALGLTLLTRFSAVQLAPAFLLLAALGAASGRLRAPARVWLGLALLPLTSLLALNAGYLFQTSLAPLSTWHFTSDSFQRLARAWPALRLPLPDACIAGFDYVSSLQAEGAIRTFLLGQVSEHTHWYYIPFALLIKWPLGFLGLLAARAAFDVWLSRATRDRIARARHAWHERFLLIPVSVLLVVAMFFAHLDVGIRYLLPIVPLLCVWIGGLLAHPARVAAARRAGLGRWRGIALALALLMAVETLSAAPYELSFFNRLAGPHPDRLINDSNVDWGQGLIALRDELRRRGIPRVQLVYHGTTDPALYGIDYEAYLGGVPSPDIDWLAVSSYYLVGLPQRMITPRGRTEALMRYELRNFWDRPPAAHLAGSIYLYRMR
jgi:4-amino-4-deoxy-L-arabinose transferase-like glycosyltransferase